jgi:hypothetical protein
VEEQEAIGAQAEVVLAVEVSAAVVAVLAAAVLQEAGNDTI